MTQKNIIVIGASRGFGRAIAARLSKRNAVTAIARSDIDLDGLTTEKGDASDPAFVDRMMKTEPDAIVLAAGIQPHLAPLQDYEWDDFQRPFQADVKMAFHWLRACLRNPKHGRRVVVFSSGAARFGSPISGGYAGAKQTQRFLCQYTRGEVERQKMDLKVQCILPQLTPNTGLGKAAVAAYAERAGVTPEEFVAKRFGEPLSPEAAADAVAKVLSGELDEHAELMLSGKGLAPLPS